MAKKQSSRRKARARSCHQDKKEIFEDKISENKIAVLAYFNIYAQDTAEHK
jgi:hypothetical protein